MTSFCMLAFLFVILLPPVLQAQITVVEGATQNSDSEQSKLPLTNTDVLKMAKSGMGEETILLAIQQGPTKFDTSPEALIELKNAGASDALLNAMLLASSTSNPQANHAANNREGCQLLRKALEAIGGPKLASIRAVRWKGTGVIQTDASEKISAQLEEVSVYPDKTYRQIQLPTGLIREVITPEFNYVSSGGTISAVPKVDLLQERAAWRSSPIYIAQRLGDYTCVPEGTEQIGNAPTTKLRISGDGIEFHWNVDPSTGRLLRVRVQTSNSEMVNDVSDWRLVDGVYVPFRSHRLVNGRTLDRTITEYQLNPMIDAKLFEPPSQGSSDSQSATLGSSTPVASTASSSHRDTNAAPLSVKGHIMGESVEEYASKMNVSLDHCRQLVSSKTSRKEKNDRKICEGLLSAAAGQRVTFGPPDDLHRYYPGSIQWSAILAEGKLAEYVMTTTEVPAAWSTFDRTLEDLIRTYGNPTTKGSESHQNGFGAVFYTGQATWGIPDGSAIFANEDFFNGNTQLRTITVVFLSPQEAQRLLAEHESRPNPFK